MRNTGPYRDKNVSACAGLRIACAIYDLPFKINVTVRSLDQYFAKSVPVFRSRVWTLECATGP